MRTGRRRPLALIAVTLVAIAIAAGCASISPTPVPPSATAPMTQALPSPFSAFPPVLTVDARGNPPAQVEIDGVDVADLVCGDGRVLAPGVGNVPPLPWSLSVVTIADHRELISTDVTQLPEWLLIFGDHALVGFTPAAGPFVPCPSSATPSAPASATTTRSTTPCHGSDLSVAMVDSSAAVGTVGGYLSFTNTGAEPCTMRGWPKVIGVTATGKATTGRDIRSGLWILAAVTDPPIVTIAPGGAAVAGFAGTDGPGEGKSVCPPSYRNLEVSPPGGTDETTISAWIPYANAYLASCSGIVLTPVAPASQLPP